MKPFLLPGALAAWAALSAWLAWQAGALSGPSWRSGFKALVFVALLPLPLLDEILAQPQFGALCRDLAVVTWPGHASRGLAVTLSSLPPQPVAGVMVPVTLRKWIYVDAQTGQAVMSFNSLEAGAGKLASALGGAAQPLVFSGTCDAGGRQQAFDALGLRLAGGLGPQPPAP